MRAIDADHLRRWILSRVFKTQLSVADVVDQIDREDTIEPERKKGQWIRFVDRGMCGCDICGEMIETERAYRAYFCPSCGADMRKAKFDEKRGKHEQNS